MSAWTCEHEWEVLHGFPDPCDVPVSLVTVDEREGGV